MKPPKTPPVVIHLKRPKVAKSVPAQKPGAPPYHKGGRAEGPPAIRKEVDPESIRSAWLSAFGKRLSIDGESGFWLDGLPVSLDHLMLETNRVRKANGLAPVGKKPEWLP